MSIQQNKIKLKIKFFFSFYFQIINSPTRLTQEKSPVQLKYLNFIAFMGRCAVRPDHCYLTFGKMKLHQVKCNYMLGWFWLYFLLLDSKQHLFFWCFYLKLKWIISNIDQPELSTYQNSFNMVFLHIVLMGQ